MRMCDRHFLSDLTCSKIIPCLVSNSTSSLEKRTIFRAHAKETRKPGRRGRKKAPVLSGYNTSVQLDYLDHVTVSDLGWRKQNVC